MNPLLGALLAVGVFCLIVALAGLIRALRAPKRNRHRRGKWPSGPAHPSFWNSDRRGHTECR